MRTDDIGRGVVWAGSAWQPGATARAFALVAFDLDAPERGTIRLPLPCFAHGIAPDPSAPHRAAIFEKHGPGAAIVDLAAMTVLRILSPLRGREFYGHGAFSADGARLYCTETELGDERHGFLGVFDTREFTRRPDLPTFGRAPHDCWLADERTLVVGNGGGARDGEAPCVVWIDATTGACLERREQPDPTQDVGHLALGSDGDLAIASAPRHGTPDPTRARGGLVITRHDGPTQPIDGPDDVLTSMIGETLSVALHRSTGTLAATNPEGNQVGFWSIYDGHHRGRLRIPMPRGVACTRDGSAFVVSFGSSGKLCLIDPDTLQPMDLPGNRVGWGAGATGSHLLVHAVGPEQL